MSEQEKKIAEIESKISNEIDSDKRDTLAVLAKAAWAVPVVATFSLGSLKTSNVWAQCANSTTCS